jgi:hypothetical protein
MISFFPDEPTRLRLHSGARFDTAFTANGMSFEPTLAVLAYSNAIIAESRALAADIRARIEKPRN